MASYFPDKWIVVKITAESKVFYKILAGWYGGFADGDSWKLSSAIKHINEYPQSYEIYCDSGSVYTCRKDCEGTTLVTLSKLHKWEAISTTQKSISHTSISTLQDLVY